jgi:hypothetical protein
LDLIGQKKSCANKADATGFAMILLCPEEHSRCPGAASPTQASKNLWRKHGGTGFLAADEFEPPPDDHFIAAP